MQDAPILYPISNATKTFGISRTRLYELMGAGVLDARKMGRRTVISADSLRAYVASLPPATIRQSKAAA